jgi:hypothetical protein
MDIDTSSPLRWDQNYIWKECDRNTSPQKNLFVGDIVLKLHIFKKIV